MDTFKAVTLAYCIGCISCGLLRELIPEESSRTVIKALSGLYILLVVMHGIKTVSPLKFSEDESQHQAQSTAYQESVLADTKHKLEQGCERQLSAKGIEATVEFVLLEQQQTVCVDAITVYTAHSLSDTEKQNVESILADYAPGTIFYQSEVDENA
jgi:hypothetical protein